MKQMGDRSVRVDVGDRATRAQTRRRALVRLIAGPQPVTLASYFRALAAIDAHANAVAPRAS